MAGLWRSVAAASVRARAFAVGSATPTTTLPAIPAPTGGSTADTQSRAAIAAIIAALETYGLTAAS